MELLTHLVEKSLVLWETQGERYRMLETVRQYAQERLKASGEEERVRTQHLDFYLAFTEKARPELLGSKQAAWLRQLDLERENILVALAWCDCVECGAENGLRLVWAMLNYWVPRCLARPGYTETVKALAREGAKERTLARCRALSAAGLLAFSMGRYAEARDHLSESLSIARDLANEQTVANALRRLGLVFFAQGERAVAKRYFEESLALARRIGEKHEVCAVLNALGEIYRCEKKWDMAAPLYEESLTLARELGIHRQSAVCLTNLSMVSISRGSPKRAYATLLEALAIAAEIETKRDGQFVIDVSAGLASSVGEWERAARFYGAAEVLSNETGIHRAPEDEAFLAPLIAKVREALGADAYNAHEAAGRALSYEQAVTEVRAWLENRS